MDIEIPKHSRTSSEKFVQEMKEYWDIDSELYDNKLFDMLLEFFQEKSERLLVQNSLLMSRWGRFCRTAVDITKFGGMFRSEQSYLRCEYVDSVERYERLKEIKILNEKRQFDLKILEEVERKQNELKGLAIIGKRKKKNGKYESRQRDSTPNLSPENRSPLGGPLEIPEHPEIGITDLTIFLRYVIAKNAGSKDMRTYLVRAKQIPFSDRLDMQNDYKTLANLVPGQGLDDSLEYYHNLNGFIATMPKRPSKLEDFITEFDSLVNFWKLETAINQEDGRPFAYEVDHKFFDNLIEQSLDSTLLPYEYVSGAANGDASNETSTLGGFPGNSGLESIITSLATITGGSSKMIPKSKFPRLRKADWLEYEHIVPDINAAQVQYQAAIDQIKDTDMELRLEHDLLLSSDNDFVGARLKETAKKLWHISAAVPHCKPFNTKITLIPQSHEYKMSQESADPRNAHVFDFGMKIPDGSPEMPNSRVLDSKKQAYGVILKANAESKRLEQEIKHADPNREFDASNFISPTVASIFAEHEVHAWLQLRHIKIRNSRIQIVRQLNFLRSVQRRFVLDAHMAKADRVPSVHDDITDSVANMYTIVI